MEVIIFIFVLVICSILITMVTVLVYRRALHNTFRRLAEAHGGTVCRRKFRSGRHPCVRFVYQGAQVLVEIHATGWKRRRRFTQLQIDWPDRRLRCEVGPRRFLQRSMRMFFRLDKLFGWEEIEIGQGWFDNEYVVRGSPEPQIRSLLSSHVQQSIHQLRSRSEPADIYVLWSGGTLLAKVRGVLRDYSRLKQFTAQVLELFDNAISTRAEGIAFLDHSTAAGNGEVICKICGEPIGRDAVLCRSCKTPHHRDCWRYYGACSTYGCGQRKFMAAGQGATTID